MESSRDRASSPEPTQARRRRGRAVILAPTAWGLRNIVLSGALDRLRRELSSVTLLTSAIADSALAEAWHGDPASAEPLLAPTGSAKGSRHRAMSAMLQASFGRRYDIATYRIFSRWRARDDRAWARLRHGAVWWLAAVGSREPFYGWQVRSLERACLRSRHAAAVIEQLGRLGPTLLVSTSCVVSDELPYILAAQRLGIPTLGCILSFDNLSSKSVLPTFDNYAVWSPRMRDEVLRLYPDRDPSRVQITGSPQFDFHLRPEYRWSRACTLQALSLEPADRYLLWAGNCATYTPTEPALVAAFAAACSRVGSLRGHHIVVRPHPADDLRRWGGLPGLGGPVVLAPPREAGTPFATSEAQARLVSSVLHADVCINMASTMSLDAAILDTPVVCVGFALEPGSLEDWLASACYRTDHYRPIASSGGVRVANSLEDLVGQAALYVKHRERDRDGRARMVREVCGPLDSRAGDGIAGLIAELAGASAVGAAPAVRSRAWIP